MATPQVEDGYTRIANELLDALIASKLPGSEWQVALFILRRTYGFHTTKATIPLPLFVAATGIAKSHVSRALAALKKKNVIKIGNGGESTYSIQKDYTKWTCYQKWQRYQKRQRSLPKMATIPYKETLKDNKSVAVSPKPPAKPRKKSTQSQHPDHPRLIEYWMDKHQDYYGYDYRFEGGKDGAAVKALLKSWPFDVCCQLIDVYFRPDKFHDKSGRTLSKLRSHANSLAQQIRLASQPQKSKAKETMMQATERMFDES